MGQCCESTNKTQLNQVNDQGNNINFYANKINNTPNFNNSQNQANNDIKTYKSKAKEIPSQNKIITKEAEKFTPGIEPEKDFKAADPLNQKADISLSHSNIDRHVSMGSSVEKFNSSKGDIDQRSSLRFSDEKPQFCNSNIYNEIGVNNNINIYNQKKEDILPLKCVNSFEAHQEKIACLTELKSGKIASGSYDCTIKIWNLNNYECEITINEEGYVFCLLEFEENMLLSGTNESSIQLWDINNRYSQSIFSFQGHELWVNSLVKCNDKFFASCSNDTNIIIWDYYLKKCLYTLKGHDDCVLTLIQLKDGRLCSGSADMTIKIWNWELSTCDATLRGHKKWVKCLFQLSNGYILSGSDDKTIKVWKDNNVINTLEGHKHSVRSICQLSKDLFASASFDKTIKIWDINTMQYVQTLEGHNSNVIGVLYYKNSDCLISCSNDHYIKLWKKSSDKKLDYEYN